MSIERFLAYLALFTGLAITVVAEYYSILGLTAIFSAAVVPVIIMGIALGLGKIAATLWLKQNWKIAPWSIRLYLMVAVIILMLITSMGIFGFLSKAHSDQSLVSGDALAKISIFDEKIKTERENIDASRKALKQLDEAVDQIMGRSKDERGAERANQIRRQQQAERSRLQRDITNSQNNIAALQSERAPIAAEVRKVEAEVGPIKYIASFVYGETDQTILEKAVTWVIIILIIVFDPLALILLLASQVSFQNFRERQEKSNFRFGPTEYIPDPEEEKFYGKPDAWVADVGEKPTAEELKETTEGDSPEKESDIVSTATVTESKPHHPDTHPYLRQGFKYPKGWTSVGPLVADPDLKKTEDITVDPNLKPELTLPELVEKYGYSSENGRIRVAGFDYSQDEFTRLMSSNYVQNEEQRESGAWNRVITEQEYRDSIERKKNESKNNTDNSTGHISK